MDVILVVSSEGRIGHHVRSVLGSQGWWVATASDREEALRAAADQQPGLVIVDCLVEGAAELVRVFGSKNGGPGVLLLEPPGDEGAFHAFEAGADQILSMPPRAQALLEAAERVMSLPHQSAASGKAQIGEKLSAAEIFGDVLVELEATDSTRAQQEVSKAKNPLIAEARPLPAAPSTSAAASPSGEIQVEQAALDSEAAGASGSPAGWVAPEATEFEDETSRDGPPSGPAERRGEAAYASPVQTSEVEPEPAAARADLEFDPETLGAESVAVSADASVPFAGPEDSAVDSAAAVPEPAGALDSDPDDRSPEPAPLAPLSVALSEDSDRFGQYRLDERIAVGGMAEVWRASMLGMEGFRKTVAIKKILPHLAENEEFVTMFVEEAKLAAQLSHENLVDIYDLGKIGESFFIAMEYVDGKDLRGVLNRLRQNGEQLPIGLALFLGAEVARGLHYAHARADGEGRPLHLVHRDVSPRNVLIGHDGRVRLCDFGVAKAVSSVVQTQIGALKGKLQYMSPEQASGRQVDNRSDIYSLGSVMYEMISGRRLYEEDNEISLLDAARAGNFDDPRKHCPGLPEEVRRILIKALAKKPSARFQSAGDLEDELRALLRTLDPTPGAQVLGTFLSSLFAPRPASDEDALVVEGSSLTAQVGRGSAAQTRTFQTRAPRDSKVVRFWWGVAAGLAAAGLAAALLVWLLG